MCLCVKVPAASINIIAHRLTASEKAGITSKPVSQFHKHSVIEQPVPVNHTLRIPEASSSQD